MKEYGYTLIELLIVISLLGIIFALSIPPYRNYIQEQAVIQTTLSVKSDLEGAKNKSASGTNGHWFGLSFQSSSAYATNNTQYQLFEITDTTNCPITIEHLDVSPCADSATKITQSKKYQNGVFLDRIWIYDSNGNHIDTTPSLDIRFSQSPNVGYVALSPKTVDITQPFKPTAVRAELLYRINNDEGTHEKAVVIDGGNICDKGSIFEPNKCGGDLTGGPLPGRIFIVTIN